jgi:hypothetical protein
VAYERKDLGVLFLELFPDYLSKPVRAYYLYFLLLDVVALGSVLRMHSKVLLLHPWHS